MSSKLAKKLESYKCFADECIFFKFIFNQDDLKNDEHEFKPEFVHQIFGEEETIFGYKNLKINYYLTPGSLDAYIGLKYKEKISPSKFEGIDADDVHDAFAKFGCSPGFTRNLDVFSSQKLVQDREFRPYGVKIHEYQRDVSSANVINENSLERVTQTYEVYRVDSTLPEFTDQKFLEYIDRVQTMLVFYIETACFIDTEDPQWTYYLLYEKRKISPSEFRYVTIGFLSMYNYYAYPDKVRSRISQILVLPTYQHCGHGAELVESLYRDASQNPNIIDITAESPSPEFMKIRDYVTAKMCSQLKSFQNREQLRIGFTQEMIQEALQKYKIPKLQSRRVYEILRLHVTNQNVDDEWKSYRLDIKKRFYLPFIRRSKYARNAGSVQDEQYNKEPMSSSSGLRDTKIKGTLESRFMESGKSTTQIGFGSSSSLSKVQEEEEEPDCVTTIGFGPRPTGASSSNTTAQVMNILNMLTSNKKSVSFAAAASAKTTSLNTSNSTTDRDDDDDSDAEDDDESDNNDSQNNNEDQPLNQANLFVSETERKKYLEQQFQEAVQDYGKILKRLEHDNLLNF